CKINRYSFRSNAGLIQCLSRCCLIRMDQPAYAELCSSEISHDDHKDVGQIARADLSKYGVPRRVIGFAIVKAPVVFFIGAKHPGEAMMAGIKVFLARLLQVRAYVGLIFHRKGKRYKLAALLLIESLTCG